jgi:hypothetical protein
MLVPDLPVEANLAADPDADERAAAGFISSLVVGGAGRTVPKMVTRPGMGLISLPLHLVWPRQTC